MKLRFQIGSSIELAKRNTSRFSTGSLPRKWSMRKIAVLGEGAVEHLVELLGRGQVAPERLLDDEPGAGGQADSGRGPR